MRCCRPDGSYEIRLEGSCRPLSVTVDGHETQDWDYEANTLTTIVRVPTCDKQRPLVVAARAAAGIRPWARLTTKM